jgi:hypothetical protein
MLYAVLAISALLAIYVVGSILLIDEPWDFTGESDRVEKPNE